MLSTQKSAGGGADNPKTDIVVTIVAIVPITIGGTTFIRIVVP